MWALILYILFNGEVLDYKIYHKSFETEQACLAEVASLLNDTKIGPKAFVEPPMTYRMACEKK